MGAPGPAAAPPDDEAVRRALRNYERFHGLAPGTARLPDLRRSSAGVAGWAAWAVLPAPEGRACRLM